MTSTITYRGNAHRMRDESVPAFLAGLSGGFQTVDLDMTCAGSQVLIDLTDQEIDQSSGDIYLIRVGGQRRRLSPHWVIPWVSGLAARHVVDLAGIVSENAPERFLRTQLLMYGHQRGWLVYEGIEERRMKAGSTEEGQ
jgi:hypothetical protein